MKILSFWSSIYNNLQFQYAPIWMRGGGYSLNPVGINLAGFGRLLQVLVNLTLVAANMQIFKQVKSN